MRAEEWIATGGGSRFRLIGANKLREELKREKGQCTWCGEPVPKPRRSWCSKACTDAYSERCDASFIRSLVFRRDRGVCELCKTDTLQLTAFLTKMWYGFRAEYGSPWLDYWREIYLYYEAHLHELGFNAGRGRLFHAALWEADHRVPVISGGGLCSLSGYRTLCLPCHKQATRELARSRSKKGNVVAVAKAGSPARKWLTKHRELFGTDDGYPSPADRQKLFDRIVSGKYVGVLTEQNVLVTGKAVMKTQEGWRLGSAGPGQQQVIATPTTTVYADIGGLTIWPLN